MSAPVQLDLFDMPVEFRCPDPECGVVEPNAYLLTINHGLSPEDARTRCWAVETRKRRAA